MKGGLVVGIKTVKKPFASSNHIAVSSTPEVLILEEGEMQQTEEQEVVPAINPGSMSQAGEVISDLPSVGETLQEVLSPIREKSSPSYADITKKKSAYNSCSSDEGPTEQFSKKAGGRKSNKEVREDEADQLKMQGSQSTIKMSFGRSMRNQPSKGVFTPSLPSK